MSWLDNLKGKDESLNLHDKAKDQQELEFKPEDLRKRLEKIDVLENSMNEIKTGNVEMLNFIKEQREAKEAARVQETVDRVKADTPEIDWYTNPEDAAARTLAPLVQNQINTNSLLMRREILEEAAFEYYTGDTKKEVDRYIDSLPLSHRADPASIKNCYYTVMGQKQAEIREGKIKSRFASVSTPSSGTGGASVKDDNKVTLTDEQKKVAREFGMTDEQYSKSNQEVNYV